MSIHVVTEIKSGSEPPERRWKLILPEVGEPDYNRQLTSFDAFFYGKRHRNFRYEGDRRGTLYHVQWEQDFEISQIIWKKTAKKYGIEYVEPEVVEVHGIWEFYKIIGFDYKTRKWM